MGFGLQSFTNCGNSCRCTFQQLRYVCFASSDMAQLAVRCSTQVAWHAQPMSRPSCPAKALLAVSCLQGAWPTRVAFSEAVPTFSRALKESLHPVWGLHCLVDARYGSTSDQADQHRTQQFYWFPRCRSA